MSDLGQGQLQRVMQSLDAGVAVFDVATGEILFENAAFFRYFAPDVAEQDSQIGSRVPVLDMDRVSTRLNDGRMLEAESEVEVGSRKVPLDIKVQPVEDSDPPLGFVQATNVSGQREAEYMLESYSKIAERNAKDLEREKDRVERLLLNIMPRPVFEEMRDYGTATPQHFELASILMLDFVGFTDMAISRDASGLVSELNDIFSAFDRIVEMSGCERLRTIGDAYMAVAGIPEPDDEHAVNIAQAALRMRRYLEKRNAAHPEQWVARIGINSGSVIGSLVGVQKYVYDLFGPGVNLAARMESMSEPMMITMNEDTRVLLENEFEISDRGEFEVKGFGMQHLWSLEAEFSDRQGRHH
ncbi:MAG: adenylate/guanylate cyclase domain-containing protein [Microthrixaceae bacterium]